MMNKSQPKSSPGGRQSPIGRLLVVLLAVAVGMWLFTRGGGSPELNGGEKLPALELVPLTGQGEPVTLDELKGKVVLVNLWATSCPPCRDELPHMADLHKRFASNDDFVLLAVSLGGGDLYWLRTDTDGLLARLNLEMPTYADPNGTTRNAFREVTGWKGGVPTSFVLDRSGVIRQVWVGFLKIFQ